MQWSGFSLVNTMDHFVVFKSLKKAVKYLEGMRQSPLPGGDLGVGRAFLY